MEDKELNSSLKLIVKSSIIVFIGLFLSKIFVFVYRAVIARYLGPEVYGLFSLAVMITSWFTIISVFGLNSGILRYIPFYIGKNEKDKIKYLFKSVFNFLFITSIFSFVLLFIFSEFISVNIFHNPNLIIFLRVFSFSVPIIVLTQLLLFLLLSFEKVNWYSFIYNVLQDFLKIFFIVILIFLGFGVNSLLISYVLSVFLAFLVSYIVCRYTLPQVFGKFDLSKNEKTKIFREVFSYSWPLLFYGIISTVLTWMDSMLIGYFIDAKNVGFYNSAVPIATLFIVTFELFSKIFSPIITKKYSENSNNVLFISNLSKQIGKWIFLFNIPLLILLFLFPGYFINIFFGKEYLTATNSLRFLSVGMFFTSIFAVSKNIIYMLGKSKIILIDTILTFVVDFILNIILIPKYGISGAAFSTMVSLIILNLLFFIQAKYYLSITPLKKEMFFVVLSAILSTILVVLLKTNIGEYSLLGVIFLGIFFILSYTLFLFVFHGLDKNDLMILKAIFKKIDT